VRRYSDELKLTAVRLSQQPGLLTEGLNTFYISKVDRRVIRLVNHEDPSAAFVFTR
jgi:hypothetical protein